MNISRALLVKNNDLLFLLGCGVAQKSDWLAISMGGERGSHIVLIWTCNGWVEGGR